MKPAQTARSIAKNVVYGFSTWFLPLGFSFVANPIIIHSLGDGDYGLYALIMGFIASSFTFSVGRAITKYIAEYRASGESEKIREIVSTTIFFNLFICLVGIVSVGVLAVWFVDDVLQIDEINKSKAVYGLYLASFAVLFTTFNQVFAAVLQGLHRFDVYAKISNYSNIIAILGNVLIAVFYKNLLYLIVWNIVYLAATCLIFYISAKKLLPEFGIEFRFNRKILKLVIIYCSNIIGYQTLANVLLMFERTLVVRHFGAEGLTYYVVPMALALYIHGFIYSLTLVVFPVASELQNDGERLLRLYQKAMTLVCCAVFFIAASTIALGGALLKLWVGEVFVQHSTALLVIHTISFSIIAIGIVSWQMTEGLGFPKINLYAYIGCFALSIPTMILLLGKFGLEGVAVGRLVGFSVLFFSIWYIEKKFFGAVQKRFWLKLFFKLTAATTFAVSVEKFIILNLAADWFVLILSGAVGAVAYSAMLLLTKFFSEEEKNFFFTLLKSRNSDEKS